MRTSRGKSLRSIGIGAQLNNRKAMVRTWIMPFLVAIGCIALGYYFSWWFVGTRLQSPLMWVWLVSAGLYAGTQVVGNWTLYLLAQRAKEPIAPRSALTVDVFVTAYREPYTMIEHSLSAACAMRGAHRTWLLDDGSDPALAALAERYGSGYITRADHRDAKAGNLNAALPQTGGDVIAIFDSDHVPEPDFLERAIGFFEDPKIGFVQVMVTFGNSLESWVAQAAMETSLEFYNPTYLGADAIGGATMMGSNALIRRSALESIGGYQSGLAEDLATSIALHAAGWKSAYVAEPLAPGQAPPTFTAWFVQQFKWARGVFELLITAFPQLFTELSWGQRLSYSVRMTKYWIGPVIGLHLFATIAVMIFASEPFRGAFHDYLIHLTPLVACDVLIRFVALQTWQHPSTPKTSLVRAVSLVYATWPIYLVAWIMAILRLPLSFRSTPKDASRLNPIWLLPQAVTLLFITLGMIFTVLISGHSPSLLLLFAIMQGFLQLVILTQWLYSEIKMTEEVPKYLLAAKNLFPSVRLTRREINGRIRTYVTDLPFTIDPLPLEGVEKAITTINYTRQQGKQIFILGDDVTVTLAGLFARELARDSAPSDTCVYRVRNTKIFYDARPKNNDLVKYKEISTLELSRLIQQGDLLVGIAADDKISSIIAGVNQAKKAKAKAILLSRAVQEPVVQADVHVTVSGDTQEQIEEALLILLHIVSKALREMIDVREKTGSEQRSPSSQTDTVNVQAFPGVVKALNQGISKVTSSNRAKIILDSLNELNKPEFDVYLPEYFLRKVLEKGLEIFGATSGSLMILDENGNVIRAAIAYEKKVNLYPAEHLTDTLQQGLAGWVLAKCQPALVIDTNHDPRWLQRTWDEPPFSRSAMSTPIMKGDCAIGVLTVVRESPGRFHVSDLDLLVAIAAIQAHHFSTFTVSANDPVKIQ